MSSVSVNDPAVASVKPGRRTLRIVATPTQWVVWGGVIAFMIFLMGTVGSVVVNSLGRTWFDSWWPQGFTTQWYGEAWTQFDLSQVFLVTLEVTGAVLAISLLIGVPASYVLARKNFPGKGLLNLLFLLPIMVPPITYGIPLATALYRFGLAGNMSGVILANLVPSVPFVIMTMTPFVEQLDPALENAARMCGAGTGVIFRRILMPLLVPGMLAAGILVLVRTVGMFELTFLTSGNSSQTIVVALFNSMNAAGIRAQQSVDAMAVMYMLMMLIILLVALKFVNPTQLVARVKEAPQD
jgi:putative spermidine/putrescine transport system permease protein